MQMCADGGALSDAALQQLADAAYTGAVRLEGGYAGWGEVSLRGCKGSDFVEVLP
jgi:rhodanese-related sulfurtransferase